MATTPITLSDLLADAHALLQTTTETVKKVGRAADAVTQAVPTIATAVKTFHIKGPMGLNGQSDQT